MPVERDKKTVGTTVLPWVGTIAMVVALIWNRSSAETTSKATVTALERLTGDFKEMRVELARVATDVAVGKAERIADREAVAKATAQLTKAMDELTVEMRKRRNEGR